MHSATDIQQSDAPRRIRDLLIAERYSVSRRTAGEWLRSMVAAGVLKKLRGITVGRVSAIDTWVANGGQVPARRGKRSAP